MDRGRAGAGTKAPRGAGLAPAGEQRQVGARWAGSGRARDAGPWRAGLRRGLRWGDLTRLLLEVGPPGRPQEEG